jgi:molybdopterin synthase catalytic subunit
LVLLINLLGKLAISGLDSFSFCPSFPLKRSLADLIADAGKYRLHLPDDTLKQVDPVIQALVLTAIVIFAAFPGSGTEITASLVAAAKASPGADRSGAIATFTGRVRARDDPDDVETTHLEFEKYDTVADDRLETLRAELTARDGVFDVRLHHRTGVLESGEDIVFVVVLAGHRTEAFRTVEDGINRLKDEVPIFKKEVTVEDTFWRHERPVE